MIFLREDNSGDNCQAKLRRSVSVEQGHPSWTHRGRVRRLSSGSDGQRLADLHAFYIECIALHAKATLADLEHVGEGWHMFFNGLLRYMLPELVEMLFI